MVRVLGLLIVVVAGCASRPHIKTSPRVEYGPLKNIVLLPLTTQDCEGVLGHALRADGTTPDRSRVVVHGKPRLTKTVQKVTVIRELSSDSRVAIGYGPASASASNDHVTHLAYVVELTGYADVGKEAPYRPESYCCFNGAVTESCAHGYVVRLVRGTGVVKYLQRAETSGGVSATEYFKTNLGERYLVVDESQFKDAYFGFETDELNQLCATIPDEASFPEIPITPTPNCSVVSYDKTGNSHHTKKYLPDDKTCAVVAEEFCTSTTNSIRCIAYFGEQLLALSKDHAPTTTTSTLANPSNASESPPTATTAAQETTKPAP